MVWYISAGLSVFDNTSLFCPKQNNFLLTQQPKSLVQLSPLQPFTTLTAMSYPFPFRATDGSDGNQQQAPFQTYYGQRISEVRAETNNEVPHDYDTAAAQRRWEAIEAARAAATETDITSEATRHGGHSLEVPAPGHYRTPTSARKRKRYSFDNDVSYGLSQVATTTTGNANINITPPDGDDTWTTHVKQEDLQLVPPALHLALHNTLSTRRASQRAASARILRTLSTDTSTTTSKSDLIASFSIKIDLLVHVAKYLRPRDIVHLYSISRDFHHTLNGNMQSSVLFWASFMCPTAGSIFPHHFYASAGSMIPDPARRPRDPAYHDIYARLTATPCLPGRCIPPPSSANPKLSQTRLVPSLIWLQMVHARHVRARDMLACLARRGHRCLPGTHTTLLKLWLLLDLPTNVDRCTLVRTKKYFTRLDMYRATLFMVKLLYRFNDPLYGPDHAALLQLMLGQRGLSPLWKLLRGKAYNTLREVLQCKMRYDYVPTAEERRVGLPIFGVGVDEMGATHLEGWGKGDCHLLRPDELIVRECARRRLGLERFLDNMAVYGYVDLDKCEEMVPTVEEMYMSDEELPNEIEGDEGVDRDEVLLGGCGNVGFLEGEWTPKHAKKAKWTELSADERRVIQEDDRDEYLQSLVFEEETSSMEDEEGEEEYSDEDDEEYSDEYMEEDMDEDAAAIMSKYPAVTVEEPETKGLFDDDSVLGEPNADPRSIVFLSDDEAHGDESPRHQPRICSTNSLAVPELQSRNCSSLHSLPAMTPPFPAHSPGALHFHGDDDAMLAMDMDMDHLDLDDDHNASTVVPSSLATTPHKAPQTDQQQESSDEEGDSMTGSEYTTEEVELTEEERQRLEDERDEELLDQAADDYSDGMLDMDWDAWAEDARRAASGSVEGEDEKPSEYPLNF